MSKLDQPLKVKHVLAAAAAIMAVGITGTAIAGGGGGGGGGGLHYVVDDRRVNANSQPTKVVRCPAGTKVVGGGVSSSAGFSGGSGMMINSSFPWDGGDGNQRPDDGWIGTVDVFQNADGDFMRVWAICKG